MDQTEFEKDNTKNCTIESNIPEILKEEGCWLGIDEAGRGPVLGPMVYGTCFSPVSLKEKFKEMGFADSKTLTEEQREEIFAKMNEAGDMMGWIIEILTPTFISNSMLSRQKYNLNSISHDCAIRLINRAVEKGVKVTEVYVDTVGDPEKYQAKLKAIFPHIDITVAKKADALFPIVSAASICAKVGRDKAIKNWKFQEGLEMEEYGSGYPGDPKTKKFMSDSLDKIFGFPQLVRFSWSTAALIIDKNAIPVKWEDDEEDDKNTVKLTSFLSKKGQDTKHQRHTYFKDRSLTSLQSF